MLSIACVSACVGGCASGADAGDSADQAESDLNSSAGVIGVSGNRLTRDGQPWTPKGVSMIGALTNWDEQDTQDAWDHFGDAELSAAKSWGADAMRLQVSQPALDPMDPQHNAHPGYVKHLEWMVSLAKQHGFAVILSMQDQIRAGGLSDSMPSESSLRAWKSLEPFAHDRSVMFELFNEPHPGNWSTWKNGGGKDRCTQSTGEESPCIGHQQLLEGVRAFGAENVILADGDAWAQTLKGLGSDDALSDSLQRLAYAVHPYTVDSNEWDARFGSPTPNDVPVVATEWNDLANGQPSGCQPQGRTMAPKLVDYLGAHHIGIFGWAFDKPNTLVKNWNWEPTTLTDFTCIGQNRPESGVGELLRDTFLAK